MLQMRSNQDLLLPTLLPRDGAGEAEQLSAQQLSKAQSALSNLDDVLQRRRAKGTAGEPAFPAAARASIGVRDGKFVA